MLTDRFLLIKALGQSLWTDVDHAICGIYAAQLAGRTPVVYWGMESIYSTAMDENAFEVFFDPVSEATLEDVVRPEHSYYPTAFAYDSVLAEDTERLMLDERDLAGLMSSDANVVVSDVYFPLRALLPYADSSHWSYGLTPCQIYRTLYRNFLRPKPQIKREIQHFYNINPNFRDERPVLGVHVRGDAIVNEVAQLYDLNEFYKPRVWEYITRYNVRHVFLITDNAKVFREYKKLYGQNDMMFFPQSKKTPFTPRIKTCLLDYPNKRHKGIEMRKDTFEIIKDTYLAAQCDFFIGNGYSNLSNTVLRLKDWPDSNIRLLY